MGIKHSQSSYLRAYKAPLYKSRESSTNQHFFMSNKPNVKDAKMNISSYITSKYEILSAWRGVKTNPIQTQFKPKQSQFWANIKGDKANSNPIFVFKHDRFNRGIASILPILTQKIRLYESIFRFVVLIELSQVFDRMVKVYPREALFGKVIL
ncbi:MAG: hypothetical protein GY774_29505 [Planctomycetes bacterium]|nr:hypothetical protein [Planctomycetota bacterium]